MNLGDAPGVRKSMQRRIWLYGGAALAIAGILTIKFADAALRIPADFRIAPEDRYARSLAAKTGASWSAVETRGEDGAPLKGWLFRPRSPNGDAVILLHGVGDTRRGMLGHARYLVEAGYACLLPDSRGHGISGGDIVTFGVKETGDVTRWAALLEETAHPSAIYGLGESMGAAILIQALAREPRIRAAVAECSFDDFRAIAAERIAQFTGIPAKPLFRPMVESALLYTRLRYGIALENASPADALRSTSTPVLLIHGTADKNIPASHSRRLAMIRPATTDLWEVPGAHHVDSLSADPSNFTRRVLDWFGGHR